MASPTAEQMQNYNLPISLKRVYRITVWYALPDQYGTDIKKHTKTKGATIKCIVGSRKEVLSGRKNAIWYDKYAILAQLTYLLVG